MIAKNKADIENITPEFLSMIKLPDERCKALNYLLVIPQMAIDDNAQYYFSVDFATISAALKASGRNVYTLNLNYKKEPLDILKQCVLSNGIDVVVTGWNFRFSFRYQPIQIILDTVREVKPKIITVVGGIMITADPEAAMEILQNADYGIIGEGEITINALAYAIESSTVSSDIGGIVSRYWINKTWSAVSDLNILPFPDYEGFEYSEMLKKSGKWGGAVNVTTRSERIAYVSISRSCINNCTFCSKTYGNTSFRQMSIDNIFRLIDWILRQYPVDVIWLFGELSFSETSFALEFCRRIKPYQLQWKAEIRADLVTNECLLAMKESGCIRVFLGIESADNNVLNSMQKNITVEQVDKTLNYAENIGLCIEGHLIIGDIEEDLRSFFRTIDWWQNHQALSTTIFLRMIRLFPGSELYSYACRSGKIADRVQYIKDGCPYINLSKIPDDDYYTLPALMRTFQRSDKLNNAIVQSQNDYSVSITGQCPHCDEVIALNNCASFIRTKPKACPACGNLISANAIEYCNALEMSRNAEVLLKGSCTAVWAITPNNFYWLQKIIPLLTSDDVVIINKSDIIVSNHTIKTLGGKAIFTPDIISKNSIDTIIVPNSREVFNSITEQCRNEFQNVKRIVHITELLKYSQNEVNK